MKIIEITEDKVDRLSEHIEKALRHAGKAMQCIEDLADGGYGERNDDWDDDDDDDDDRMGERYYGRGRSYGRGMGQRRSRRDSRGRYR